MSKLVRVCFFVIGLLLTMQHSLAEEGVRGRLVDTSWLARNLKSSDLVLLDASPETYGKGHIPGAQSVNIYDLFAYGFGGISDSKIEEDFRSWGVGPEKKIVMYDAGGQELATRLFFDLDYHGVPEQNLFILDGGLSKWKKEALPLSTERVPSPKNGTFKLTKLNEDLRGGLPEVLDATGDTTHNALLEGLGPDWHYGQIAPFSKAGHIPTGILTPVGDFYNADKTFKSPEEIRQMLTFLGVKEEQQIYTYCGGGVAATVPYFAAKYLAGYPKVKLYPESELGWLNDERGLPYWTYDEPYLMRETNWLQFWSSQMIRSFLGAPVSVVDVRPQAEFNQGHIPYSLNISSEVFRANVTTPEKLAEILGPAGVHASDEAVVVSGAGLTKDSALAYVMLENLGQKKVSMFMDSMDTWTKRGQHLVKDPTVVGPKKAPHDAAIVPISYPSNAGTDVLMNSPRAGQDPYPVVFVASGKELPAKSQNGKTVHVNYADLLNADGTPKAAKDIWTTLEKAGVPRYAQLICVSDDPGEAAVNYFILKLMGFRDVKVLVS